MRSQAMSNPLDNIDPPKPGDQFHHGGIPMEVWIVGRDGAGLCTPWELQGVYSTESLAAARCEDASWFIMPLALDAHVPSETMHHPRESRPRADGASVHRSTTT